LKIFGWKLRFLAFYSTMPTITLMKGDLRPVVGLSSVTYTTYCG